MSEQQVAVVEGPKGKAEIIEVIEIGKPMEYRVKIGDATETYKSLGEAYITAGEKVGTKV
jgi:hypothetical protein